MQTLRVLIHVLGLLALPLTTATLRAQTERPPRVTSSPASLVVESGRLGNIAMLRADLPGMDHDSPGKLASALRQAGFGVTTLTASQAIDPLVLTPHHFFLYILPDAQVYPAAGFRTLSAYLHDGGHMVFLGGPALTRSAWFYHDQWFDKDRIRDRISRLTPEHILFDFEGELGGWTRGTDNPQEKAAFETEAGSRPNLGRCAKFWTAKLTGWNTYASPRQEHLFAPGQELLCFWARGDARTAQMLVEMNEADGSRWMAVVPLEDHWTYHVLKPDDFQFWPDSSNSARGGADARFQPRNAVRIVLGLARSHLTALGDGPHAFWIDQVGTAANPFSGLTAQRGEVFPPLETITPSYKTYPLEHVSSVVAAPEQAVIDESIHVPVLSSSFSTIARPAGRGFGNRLSLAVDPTSGGT